MVSDDDDNDYWGGYMTEWLFRDIKIKSRAEFEEDFDGIKELIAAKTLFMVDDKISMFEEVPFLGKSCNLTNLSFLRRRHHHLHKANMSVTSSAFGIQLLILKCPFTEFLNLLQWQKPTLKSFNWIWKSQFVNIYNLWSVGFFNKKANLTIFPDGLK